MRLFEFLKNDHIDVETQFRFDSFKAYF